MSDAIEQVTPLEKHKPRLQGIRANLYATRDEAMAVDLADYAAKLEVWHDTLGRNFLAERAMLRERNERIAALEAENARLLALVTQQSEHAERLGAELEQTRAGTWTPIAADTRIMCACGDPSCYKAIVSGNILIEAYEDVSDLGNSDFVLVDLPADIRLCRLIPGTPATGAATAFAEMRAKYGHLFDGMSDADITALRHGASEE